MDTTAPAGLYRVSMTTEKNHLVYQHKRMREAANGYLKLRLAHKKTEQ